MVSTNLFIPYEELYAWIADSVDADLNPALTMLNITWDVWASDAWVDVSSANGPFSLVVDAGSNATAGILGDILAERLKVRDVAAVVTDGAVRDSGELEEINLPIYSGSRAAPASIAGLFAVELQVPICCGNVAVFPGDLMAGDKDGVLVVPRALAKEIADEAPEQERYEQFAREQISKGQSLIGIYPASDESRLDFERWDKENS